MPGPGDKPQLFTESKIYPYTYLCIAYLSSPSAWQGKMKY